MMRSRRVVTGGIDKGSSIGISQRKRNTQKLPDKDAQNTNMQKKSTPKGASHIINQKITD
jgi:hypothetical protein